MASVVTYLVHMPIDVCNIIANYTNTVIVVNDENIVYNNDVYTLDEELCLYRNGVLYINDIDRFTIRIVNGIDCLIAYNESIINIENLATNVVYKYKPTSDILQVKYWENCIYYNIDTYESDNDHTYIVYIVEISDDFQFIVRNFGDISGWLMYIDDNIIILRCTYVYSTDELAIYTSDLSYITTIDIRHVDRYTWSDNITKINNELYCKNDRSNAYWQIDIKNSHLVKTDLIIVD